jgi:hypothetical protein
MAPFSIEVCVLGGMENPFAYGNSDLWLSVWRALAEQLEKMTRE